MEHVTCDLKKKKKVQLKKEEKKKKARKEVALLPHYIVYLAISK